MSYEYKREALTYRACDETVEYPKWVQACVNAMAYDGWRVLQIEEDGQGPDEVDVYVWLEREIPPVVQMMDI